MGIDKKRRFRSAFPLELGLHALQLHARFFNRAAEPLDFLSHLVRPQFEIERDKQGIKRPDGLSDCRTDGRYNTVHDALLTHPDRYSQMLSTACSSSTPSARTPTLEPNPAD